jgi:WD40 repeat protein
MRTGIILAICGCILAFPIALRAQEPKQVRTLKHERVRSLAFLPDGKTLASAGAGDVRLWEVSTGKRVAALKRKGSPDAINLIVLSSDGKALAWWDRSQVLTLWNVTAGKEIKSIEIDGETPVLAMAFAPDGASLLTYGSDGTMRRWAVPSAQQTETVKGKISFRSVEGGYHHLFTSDFKTLARGEQDRCVRVYESTTGKELAKLKNDDPFAPFDRLAFAPGNKLLAAAEGYMSQDGFARIKLWKVGTDKVRILKGHEKSAIARALAFRADGKVLASGGEDGSLKLWDVETGKELAALPAPPAKGTQPTNEITTLQFSRDGRTLAWGTVGDVLVLWDVSDVVPEKKTR